MEMLGGLLWAGIGDIALTGTFQQLISWVSSFKSHEWLLTYTKWLHPCPKKVLKLIPSASLPPTLPNASWIVPLTVIQRVKHMSLWMPFPLKPPCWLQERSHHTRRNTKQPHGEDTLKCSGWDVSFHAIPVSLNSQTPCHLTHPYCALSDLLDSSS